MTRPEFLASTPSPAVAEALWGLGRLRFSLRHPLTVLTDRLVCGPLDARSAVLAAEGLAALQSPNASVLAFLANCTLGTDPPRVPDDYLPALLKAFARLGFRPSPAQAARARERLRHDAMDEAEAARLPFLLGAFATLGGADPSVVAALCRRVALAVPVIDLPSLPALLWATARLLAPRSLSLAVATAATRRLENPVTLGALEDSAFSACVAALASLGARDPELWAALWADTARRSPSLPSRSLATLVWALVTVGPLGTTEAGAVAGAAIWARVRDPAVLADLSCRDAAVVAWASVRVRYADAPGLLGAVARRLTGIGLRGCNARDVAMLAWAQAQLGVADPPWLQLLAEHALRPGVLSGASPLSLGAIAAAFGLLRVPQPTLLSTVAHRLVAWPTDPPLAAEPLVATLTAFARLGIRDATVVAPLLTRLAETESLAAAAAPTLAATLWAMATLEMTDDLLLAVVLQRCLAPGVLGAFGLRESVAAAWALTRLEVRDDDLLAGVARQLTRHSPPPPVQEASLVLWGFARLGHRNPTYQAAVTRWALQAEWLGAGEAVDVARLAWGCAALGDRSPTLFWSVARHLEGRLHDAPPMAVGMAAWAFGALWVRDLPLVAAVAHRVGQPGFLAVCSGREVANIAWGLARLAAPEPLAGPIAAHLAARGLASFKTQEVAMVAWAFASLRLGESAVPEAIAAAAGRPDFLAACAPKTLALLAWSLGRLGGPHAAPAVHALVARALTTDVVDRLQSLDLLFLLWAFPPDVGPPPPALLHAVADRMMTAALHGLSPSERRRLARSCAAAYSGAWQAAPSAAAFASSLAPSEVALAVWSLATTRDPDSALVAAVAPRAADPGGLPGLSPTGAAQLAWALAAYGHRPEALIWSLAQAVDSGAVTGLLPGDAWAVGAACDALAIPLPHSLRLRGVVASGSIGRPPPSGRRDDGRQRPDWTPAGY